MQTESTQSGIYKITNLINGKFYIGSAVNFKFRLSVHICDLNKSNHPNSYFSKSWNKHGSENFKFEILEIVEDRSNLITREQYYLDTLLFAQEFIKKEDKRFKTLGYNLAPTASSMLGFKHSEENRKKQSERQKGRICKGKGIKKQEGFYDKIRKTIQERYNGGYKFTEEQLLKVRKAQAKRKGVSLSKEWCEKITQGKLGKPMVNNRIMVVELNKELVAINAFDSTKLAALHYNINRTCITNCIKGRFKTANGSIWMHYNDYINKFNV